MERERASLRTHTHAQKNNRKRDISGGTHHRRHRNSTVMGKGEKKGGREI